MYSVFLTAAPIVTSHFWNNHHSQSFTYLVAGTAPGQPNGQNVRLCVERLLHVAPTFRNHVVGEIT